MPQIFTQPRLATCNNFRKLPNYISSYSFDLKEVSKLKEIITKFIVPKDEKATPSTTSLRNFSYWSI